MPLYQDEGVVLRTAKLGEADRILTLLTSGLSGIRDCSARLVLQHFVPAVG